MLEYQTGEERKSKFGQRLRELRARYRVTQEQIADIVKKSQRTIGHWERDRNQPDNEDLVKIAKYFRVSTDYLLGVSDFETSSLSRTDDRLSDLPEEAQKSVEEFMEFIRQKYGKKPEE